jgi:hypothetical protein
MKVFLVVLILSGHVRDKDVYPFETWELCLQAVKEGRFISGPEGKESISAFCVKKPPTNDGKSE